MSTPAPQVRVRLSAQGVQDVVAALRTVERQAKQTATAGDRLRGALGNLKGLLPAIGVGAIAAGFVALAKGALETADAIGKVAAKTGSTAEDISALAVAGRTAGVSLEQIQAGVTKANVAVGDLKNGNDAAQKSFAKLGLTAKDFAGKSGTQSYELIAKRLLAIKDAAQLASVGADILGKSFADQLPLLQTLADEGLGKLRERAQELGLLLSGDLTKAAEDANDGFALIKLQAEGLATSFIAGLAPVIVDAMGQFSKATKGDGVEAMKEFGKETGRILVVVMQTFRIFFTVVSEIFTRIGNQIATLAGIYGAVFSGNFSEAVSIWKEASKRSLQDFETFEETFTRQLRELVDLANREAPPIELKTKPTDDAAARRAAAILAAANAAEEQRKGESAAKRAAQARIDLEQKILQATKRTRDAKIAALNEEIGKYEEAFRAANGGKLNSADASSLAQYREAGLKRIEEDEAREIGQLRLDLEQKLLEASGKTREARLSALDEEIKKLKELFAAANGGELSAADEASIGQYREKSVQRIDFDEVAKQGQAALEELAATRARIEQDVQLGITSQYQGQQQILEIERQRVVVLEELAAKLLAAAQATGDPELIRQAEEFGRRVESVRVSVDNASDAFTKLKKGAEDALQKGIKDVLVNLQDFESVGDVFRSLASSVAGALQQIAAEMLATYLASTLLKAAMSAFGSGGAKDGGIIGKKAGGFMAPRRYAAGGGVDGTAGGLLRGPGSSLSDSIRAYSPSGPVMLSDGEFIVRAAAVRQPGVRGLLEAINAGNSALNASVRGMPRRFADGGALASDMSPAKATAGGFAGVIGLEPGLVMKELESDQFDRLLVKRLERNRTSLKSIVSA